MRDVIDQCEDGLHSEAEQLAKEIKDWEKEKGRLYDRIKRHEEDRKQSEAQAMELKKKIADLARERTVQYYGLISV